MSPSVVDYFVSVGFLADVGLTGPVGLAPSMGFSLPLASTERHSAGS
jgi:hypothetical protein